GEIPIQTPQVVLTGFVELAQDGREKSPSVGTPASLSAILVGYQRAGELLGVVQLHDLGEQIPSRRPTIEGIQDHITARVLQELLEVATVWIGDHGALPSPESAAQKLPDDGRLASSRGSDDLE